MPTNKPNITLWAITHINSDGDRVLTFANQGRNHYATKEKALAQLEALNTTGDLTRKRAIKADTLEVRAVECYWHGDAINVFANEEAVMNSNPLCTECSLPILPDDERVSLPEEDDSPWKGFHYHKECYEEGRDDE